jgi:hypothetical protein
MITTQSLAHDLADQNDHDWLLRDDLAWVEIPARVHCGEEAVDHVHTRSRDVLLKPRGMLGANRVVVRQCAGRVDERLLDGVLDSLVLAKRVDAVVLETEGEVQAGAGVIGVRGGT